MAWLIYAQSRSRLIDYLTTDQVHGNLERIADFSIQQACWPAVVLFFATGLLALIFSGVLTTRRRRSMGICLAILLVGDLGSANLPWVVYWDYHDKYASDAVIDILREKPSEHRVACSPFASSSTETWLSSLYQGPWLQQLFPYYNIRSCELVDTARMPDDFGVWWGMVQNHAGEDRWFRLARMWQLTGCRQVLAPAEFGGFVLQQKDCQWEQLQTIVRFRLVPKFGIVAPKYADQLNAVVDRDGPFAVFDFSEALPTAKLFYQWEIQTNQPAALARVFDPAFDPTQTVSVQEEVSPAAAGGGGSVAPGKAEIVHYAPKDIVVHTDGSAPAVLLLTDRVDPNWKVWVDGRPDKILRCDFLLRGVQLPAGTHQVEFKFQPPTTWLKVSLAALTVAFMALVVLLLRTRKDLAVAPAPAVERVVAAPVTLPAAVPARRAGKVRSRDGKVAK